MTTPALLVTLFLAAATPAAASQGSAGRAPDRDPASALRASVERRLHELAASLDGVLGYMVVDLTDGSRISRLEKAVLPTASTIKIAILYELFKRAEEGTVRLDDTRELDRQYVVGGSGVLRELTSPSMSLRDYATLMIVLSDNTATNVLIDELGMDRIAARIAALGLHETRLRRRMIDLAAARRGDENVSTPEDLAMLLDAIYRSEGLSPESQQALLAVLKKGKSSPLVRGVAPGTDVASKDGTLEGVVVDAGIVYVEGRPYIFTAMAAFLADDEDGGVAIEQASRLVFDYFSRLARSSEYGRRIRN